MSHLPLPQQTATPERINERNFVSITHDFNSGIRFYRSLNKTTITRYSYKFLDIVNPTARIYVISDQTPALNTPIPSDPTSTVDSIFTPVTTQGLPVLMRLSLTLSLLLTYLFSPKKLSLRVCKK